MIRRLLSLIYGGVAYWVVFLLTCTWLFDLTPYGVILGAQTGTMGFYRAAAAALIPVAAMILLLSRLPLIKRGWANAGCMALAAVTLLLSLVFFGSGVDGAQDVMASTSFLFL